MQNNMIPLTVANTLDQTTKQRIEAKPNQTLKQAVQAQKLAPEGAFDVYDQLGKVISETSVANHRDATVYVGVAKVAGGAFKSASLSKLKRSEYPSMRHINQHSTWPLLRLENLNYSVFIAGQNTLTCFCMHRD